MKNIIKAVTAGLLILVLSVTGCIEEGLEIGNRAPDFKLSNIDKQTVSLEDNRGHPVLLNFWATWCGPCRSEMPFLQQIHDEWADEGLVVMAVDVGENQATVEEYLDANNLSIPVLLDTNAEVFIMYRIFNIPTTFFIDKDGIIREKVVGAFPSKEAIEAKLDRIIQ